MSVNAFPDIPRATVTVAGLDERDALYAELADQDLCVTFTTERRNGSFTVTYLTRPVTADDTM
jgi:hypothetical protein